MSVPFLIAAWALAGFTSVGALVGAVLMVSAARVTLRDNKRSRTILDTPYRRETDRLRINSEYGKSAYPPQFKDVT